MDTAGRLSIDEALMAELKAVKAAAQPHEVLLVLDAMQGQDALPTATRFHETIGVDGIILTKLDGDARGGAALSALAVTGKPIKFIGTGEKADALEPFHPDRMAGRILGLGDVVSLVERVQGQVDLESAQRLAKKAGKGLDLDDLLEQMLQIRKMGSLKELAAMLPGAGKLKDADLDENRVKQNIAILQSMTAKERRRPEIIHGERRKRIAKGSGTKVEQVNQLLRQHEEMRKMMKKMAQGGKAPGLQPSWRHAVPGHAPLTKEPTVRGRIALLLCLSLGLAPALPLLADPSTEFRAGFRRQGSAATASSVSAAEAAVANTAAAAAAPPPPRRALPDESTDAAAPAPAEDAKEGPSTLPKDKVVVPGEAKPVEAPESKYKFSNFILGFAGGALLGGVGGFLLGTSGPNGIDWSKARVIPYLRRRRRHHRRLRPAFGWAPTPRRRRGLPRWRAVRRRPRWACRPACISRGRWRPGPSYFRTIRSARDDHGALQKRRRKKGRPERRRREGRRQGRVRQGDQGLPGRLEARPQL